jgi:hypothetical protein
MPSFFSANLLLELMADGENEVLWGDITNENLEILGRAAGGVGNITLTGTTHTLTVAQGALSEGQYSVLVLGGAPTGTNTVTISPSDQQKFFVVKNGSGESVILTQGSGGNVTIANVSVIGVQTSAQTSRVLVWGREIPDPGTVWTEIAA